MRKTHPHRNSASKGPATMLCIAWYRREQQPRRREFSEDAGELEETYEEWVHEAERAIASMPLKGRGVKKSRRRH
jgi:hypothetical protein